LQSISTAGVPLVVSPFLGPMHLSTPEMLARIKVLGKSAA
jgi:hypothetical protein